MLTKLLFYAPLAKAETVNRTLQSSTTVTAPSESPAKDNRLAQEEPADLMLLPATQNSVTAGTQQALNPASLNPAKSGHGLMRNLLLTMALEQDPVLIKLIKKQGIANVIIGLGAIGTYGVALGNDIYVGHIAYTQPIPKGIKDATTRLRVTANLALIDSGIGIVSIGMATWWLVRTKRKIAKRKKFIIEEVDTILIQLRNGSSDAAVKDPLMTLLKDDEAVSEFLNLWHSAHPKATAKSPLTENETETEKAAPN